MPELKRLSPRHSRFVEAFVSFGLAERAAIVAGFSPASARTQAANMLKSPLIAAAIEARQREVARALKITPERVLAEVAKLAFSEPGTIYATLRANGYDLFALTKDERAALTTFSEDSYVEGRGKNAQKIKKHKVSVADKKGALELLMKNLGMVTERVRLEGVDSITERLRRGRERMAKAKSA